MSNKNFEKLATTLTDSEKKSLLSQISDNLNSNPLVGDEKYASFVEKENRDYKIKSLKKDIEELGFIQKLILNIKSFVMGKDILEIHNNDLLIGLERRITYTAPNLVAIKKRRFTSILITDFIKINSLVSPFVEYFIKVWESPIALERLISDILVDKNGTIKTSLSDFLRESEMDKLIENGNDLDEIKKILLKSLYDYRKKLPESVFPETEEELMSLISLKNIVLYNYTPIFKLMGVSPEDRDLSSKSVSMSLVVKYLEEFYKLLIHFSGSKIPKNTIESLLRQSTEESEFEELKEIFYNDYNNLTEKLKSLIVDYPFEDLIRFSRSNPFYKIDFTVQKINVEDFYFTALKKELMSELQVLFEERDKAVVTNILSGLFSGQTDIKLHNYVEHKDFDYKSIGLSYFKYIESAHILYNFIHFYYLREYKDLIFVLSKHIYEKNHLLQSRSLEVSIGIETLLERLLRFDRSLAPENEAGKTMRTLFSSVATNKQNVRMYKAFIKQKDSDVLELLKLGLKLLQDMEKILVQTLKSPSDTVKLQISAIHPSISRKLILKDVLVNKITELKKFQDVFNKKVTFDSQE
ncbi:MAG: hypothetical protein JXR64_08680 [Spirochaetales bacterium]|nr:hypothetical protein [Spirochaetales bacterium]